MFKPWRGTFYPAKLPQAREARACQPRPHHTIEINGTFYGSQKPATFRRWAAETPEDFVFSLKGPRFATHRRVLAEAGASVERVLRRAVPVLELKEKLGPVLWQLPPTKAFESADFAAFLGLLPQRLDGRPIRHVVEVRHASFCVPEFVALMRQFGVAIALIDSEKHPLIPDPTGDFLYLRLQRTSEEIDTGYAKADLATWAKRARAFADGGAPADLATLRAGGRRRPSATCSST